MPTSRSSDAPAEASATFESWGRYPKYSARIIPLAWQNDFPNNIRGLHNGVIPAGMGRSYGDVGLLKDGNLLLTTGMDRLLAFDPETGILTAESGITLAQILDFAVPRGFFLPVTPGTKYVTLGGAIANDIHGKNHELAGSFGNHVPCFELVRSDGSRRLCSATENPDFYAATIGGMGLTGLITWAQLRMKPIVSRLIDYEGIQYHGIDEFLALKEKYKHVEYTVSWVDCVSTGKNFARGVMMVGDHTKEPGPLPQTPEPKLAVPFDLPGFLLNKTTVSMFNTAFFHKQIKSHVVTKQDYEPFFYPLDKVLHWNRGYGKNGLLQFQYAIPWEGAVEGTVAILKEIAKSGLASFLAVLKAFGDIPSLGMMSFPTPGIMFALDFPIKDNISFPLMQRLGDMTRDYGGRLYSAKDACMTPEQFRAFYPNWQNFARYRDPAFTSSYWERVTGETPTL
ncbi:FAD/FMN-containing dehydrogenase [Granulicella pectinivorans]|jgi:FAD/FMN-containing dehydrogenase|uniref:FAD/FMN-containing dehydrogenase n=1 Tax=Granulicella pectinivorans TaxID=474950 RepID=A0A1I6LS58_9BACT|nr:FAD-binding oxidoreductase [Granulicella pectinivorans]SFS06325.1 FAD/FMN-containing dehydrogenase [Granulicella pectinivorans]